MKSFHYLSTVTAPKSWAGGKVQLGYVAPHMKLDEIQKMCFCKLPGSIFLLCKLTIYTC